MVSIGRSAHSQTSLFNDMIVAPKRERPSTANTMVLVLRPPSEDFKQLAQLTGSEMERTAHRKNRVIQMKLSAYLAEVCQQQRSSARLHKTEEYRFLQEVERRSSVPRSVNMLNQLQQFTRRTFPDAPYSYVDEVSVNSRATSAVHRPSLPLSARGPGRGLRTSRQMLDRPRTSAPVLRPTPVQEGEEGLLPPDAGESMLSLPRQPLPCSETTVDLLTLHGPADHKTHQRPVTSGQTTELPDIYSAKGPEDSESAGFRTIPLTRGADIEQDSTKRVSSVVPLERCSSTSSLLPRKRRDSLRRAGTVGKFNASDLPSYDESKDDADTEAVEVFEPDTRMPPLTELQFNLMEEAAPEEEIPKTSADDVINSMEDAAAVKEDGIDLHFSEDYQLGIVDLDKEDLNSLAQTQARKNSATSFSKRSSKPARKTNFNRIKTEPVMPLRHNITSVLRQERTKYEASQSKIKDYLHKMTSRDFMTRAVHTSRETNSAHSRRSSVPRK